MSDQSLVQIEARAKINLFLEVIGKRDDGYHNIVSVFQEVDLADRLFAVEAEKIRLCCDSKAIPCDRSNLVVKAVERLREVSGLRRGLSIRLEKNIPIGGGLGGGSSDAAAALRLACRVWGLPEDMDVLRVIAAEIGSDVPFFLYGGTCLCEGRGEVVTPLDDISMNFMLIFPGWGINTALAYRALGSCNLGTKRVEPFLDALRSGSSANIGRESYNRFEEVMQELEPRQAELIGRLEKIDGLYARMSGSGSTLWAVCCDCGKEKTEEPLLDGIKVVKTCAYGRAGQS